VTEQRRVRWWIGLGLAALVLLWLLRDALLPFVVAFGIAFLLDPLVDWLEQRGLGRSLASALVLVLFLLVLVGFLVLVAPMIVGQAVDFMRHMPQYLTRLHDWAVPILERWRTQLGLDQPIAPSAPVEEARRGAADFAQWLAGATGSIVTGSIAAIEVMTTVVLTPVVAFYLLRDWDVMVAKIDSWLPPRYAPTLRALALESNRTIVGYARGQALVCLSLGVFYAAALSIVGLQFGLSIGLAAGVISFIPFVGTIVGGVLAIGTALAQFPPDWLRVGVVVAIFVVGQFAEGHILAPRLVGSRVGLHAVWVIFALVAGGVLFGFTGVLLAVPVAAVIGVLCRFVLGRYLASPLYGGDHPDARPPLVVVVEEDGE
jgi:predicted PurR-regulated permease PerM